MPSTNQKKEWSIDEFRNGVQESDDVDEYIRENLPKLIHSRNEFLVEKLEAEKLEVPHGYFAQPVRAPSHAVTYNNAINKAQEIIRNQE